MYLVELCPLAVWLLAVRNCAARPSNDLSVKGYLGEPK